MTRRIPFDPHAVELRGTALVEASAGTGKTYSIAVLFLRFIVEMKIPLEKILVVTYTRAATAELKGRIRHFLRAAVEIWEGRPACTRGTEDDIQKIVTRSLESPDSEERFGLLKQAVICFDEAAIFTIHGFCQRVLGDYAFETGSLYTVEMITDQGEIVREIVEDYYRSMIVPAPAPVAAYLRSRKCTVDMLMAFIGGAINHQLVELRYPRDAVQENALLAWNSVKNGWKNSAEDIENILMTSPDLNRNNKNGFKQQSLETLFRQVNFCMEHDDADYGVFSKFTASNMTEQTKAKKTTPEHPFFTLCQNLVDAMESNMHRLKGELFRFVRDELPLRKERNNVQYFDDLLVRLYDALKSEGQGEMLVRALRGKYRAALIDEFQDTDALQYFIFNGIFNHGDGILFLIGDPKQSIYGFRGADVFSYIEASGKIARKHTLKINWRSEARLVQAFNELFARENPFVFKGIGYEDVEAAGKADESPLLIDGERRPPMVIWNYPSEQPLSKGAAQPMIIEGVVAEMQHLLSGGAVLGGNRVRPGHIAILVQKWYEARDLKLALDAAGIPAIMSGVAGVFASGEARDLMLVLRAVAEPSNDSSMRGALVTNLMGYAPPYLENFNRDDLLREEWLQRFREYHRLWEKKGFIYMISSLFSDNGIKTGLMAATDGERRLTNLFHLVELLHRQSIHGVTGIHDLVKWFMERISDEKTRSEEYEQRLESDENAVRIVTVHRSKGLQYPIVFCPFLWDTADLRDESAFTYHDGTKEYLAVGIDDAAAVEAAGRESLGEKLRLFYVAVTRAQHRCYLAWGNFNKTGGSAAWYLLNDMEERLGRSKVISIEEAPLMGASRYERSLPDTEYACRSFSGAITRRWKISSFSALAGGHSYAGVEDRDGLAGETMEKATAAAVSPEKTAVLPGGARTGTALHRIFELIDFTAPDLEAVIPAVLAEYDLLGEKGDAVEAARGMVERVLAVQLGEGDSFTLSMVSWEDRLTELEFFFPIGHLSPDSLQCIDDGIRIDEVEGFLHGFIDCIFRVGERYYIIDWKSNYLGDSPEDYGEEKLGEAMKKHRYDLQYHIYTVALHRYLSLTLGNYSYEKNFGGVYYIFLRGAAPGTRFGIFYDRPGREKVEKIMTMMAG